MTFIKNVATLLRKLNLNFKIFISVYRGVGIVDLHQMYKVEQKR